MRNSEDKKPRLIDSYLHQKDSSLSEIYKKAIAIQELDCKLKTLLDSSLSEHFVLANITPEVAIILVKSSSWATRLRYNIPIILAILKNRLNCKKIKTVRVKIQHFQAEKRNIEKKSVFLSKNTTQLLLHTAQHTDDPQLKECFVNLSKNGG